MFYSSERPPTGPWSRLLELQQQLEANAIPTHQAVELVQRDQRVFQESLSLLQSHCWEESAGLVDGLMESYDLFLGACESLLEGLLHQDGSALRQASHWLWDSWSVFSEVESEVLAQREPQCSLGLA